MQEDTDAHASGVRRAANVAYIEKDDGAILLGLDDATPRPLVLNGSATAVWDAVDDASDTELIIDRLAEQFGIESSVIEADVRGVLDRLAESGLVTYPGGAR